MIKEEYFGSDDQRAVLRRGRAMAELLGRDARHSYYGRTVGLVSPDDGDIDHLAALVRAQGNSNCSAVPLDQAAAYKDALAARGLVPLHYAKWEGTASPVVAARIAVENMSLPGDLSVVKVDASTPDDMIVSLATMALSCGVLPLNGEVLRGLLRPAVCLIAVNKSKKVVSCAAAATFAHQDHKTFGKQAWWGMLATDPSYRGQGLALGLGAQAILEMNSDFGVKDFMTGVQPGNAASEAVCGRMGLVPGKFAIIGCADPQALANGRMTK